MKKLIDIAQRLCTPRKLNQGVYCGEVAAALETISGSIYTGICVVSPCGMGFCAEHSAIAEMLKNGESEIKSIVAVSKEGILPPCGRCREFMRQINPHNYFVTQVVLDDEKTIPLSELLPSPFYINSESCS